MYFAHTFDPKLKTGQSKIILYKNFDEKINSYYGDLNIKSI